ncbi:MAG: hypothetical protein JW993_04305 [Sedimentisphaerales bacterium]|nr:hypothetical protein [Sedimentisphaerales bacterium]
MDAWVRKQEERQALLEELLQGWNEGRSMSFYCKACSRMPIDLLKGAIEEAEDELALETIGKSDMKARAKVLKVAIKNLALEVDVDLR